MYRIKRINKKHPRAYKKIQKNEGINVSGIYKMYSIRNNIKTLIGKKKNLITSDALDKLVNSFINTCTGYYYKIEYVALGNDNTTPTVTDTALGNEVYRTPYVVRNNSATGVVTVDFYITDSDFIGTIEEVGIFGGVTASGTSDSGNLLSHVLWSYEKSGSEELLIEYTITLSQV